jgi:hypothetical protein
VATLTPNCGAKAAITVDLSLTKVRRTIGKYFSFTVPPTIMLFSNEMMAS